MFLTDLRRSAALGLAFVLLAALVGCGKTDTGPAATQPPAVNSGPTGEAGGGDKKTDNKPDFTMTAKELIEECQMDKEEFKKKYEGKSIEVSGKVSLMTTLNGPSLRFWEGKDPLVGVWCRTREPAPWAKVGVGSQVTLRGKGSTDSVFGCFLDECSLVKSGENPPLKVAAEELAKQYKADKGKTREKYLGKSLIVEGEVLNLVGGAVILKGDAPWDLACIVDRGDIAKTMVEQMKVGERVTFTGIFGGMTTSAQTLELGSFNLQLHSAIPIPPEK